MPTPGRYAHLILPDRFAGARMPDISRHRSARQPPERGRFLVAAAGRRDRRDAGRGAAGAAVPQPARLCAADALPHMRPPHSSARNCSAWLVEHRFRQQLIATIAAFTERLPDLPAMRRGGLARRRAGPASSGSPRRSRSAFPARAPSSCPATSSAASARMRERSRRSRAATRRSSSARSWSPRATTSRIWRWSASSMAILSLARRPARGGAHLSAPVAGDGPRRARRRRRRAWLHPDAICPSIRSCRRSSPATARAS